MIKRLKIILLSCLFIISGQFLHAQLEAGMKIGASSSKFISSQLGTITLKDASVDKYTLSVDDVKFGYHFGLYSRLKVWKVILQPEVLLNSNSVKYKLEDISNPEEFEILKEQYTSLDIPLTLGLKFSWFNIHGGISGHVPLANTSELKDIEGYNITKSNFTYSYLGGIGLNIMKFRFDFRYELSTTFFGDHITYKGEKYHFEDKDNRLIAGMGYKF